MKVSKKEIAKFQNKEQKQLAGREVNRVQDRKTGEWYNPQERFDELMNKPEITAMLNRLKIR
jgi:predicted nucleotidyltransferase